jgi:hypothetical protein
MNYESPLRHSSLSVGHSTLRKYQVVVPGTLPAIGLREKKKNKSRKAAKPPRVRRGGRQTFSSFQVYFSKFLKCLLGDSGLCVLPTAGRLCEKKKEKRIAPRNSAGQAAK